MADPVTRAGRPPAKGEGGKLMGQPAWMWAAGAGVVILGYLIIRSKSSKSGQGSGQGTGAQRPQGGPGGWSTQTFKIWVRDHHGRPAGHPEDRWISHGH